MPEPVQRINPLREVPQSAVTAAWIGLVSALNHPWKSCNDGLPWRCFVCDGLSALLPFHVPAGEVSDAL